MALRNEDTVAGTAITIMGVAIIWLSLGMRAGAATATLPPNFFPIVCAVGLTVCGAILLLRGLRAEAASLPQVVNRRVAVVGVTLVGFYWFFGAIDFRVGAMMLTVITMLVFGIRSLSQLIIFPLGLTIGLYYAFTRGFGLVLPTWM